MSYLARLKAKIAEKHPPEELTKLPKGASVSFGSDRSSRLSDNEALGGDLVSVVAGDLPHADISNRGGIRTPLTEKRLPDELTKVPKAPFVSSVSDQGRRISSDDAGHENREGALAGAADAIEERRAIIADTCPAPYGDTFARLNHQKPHAVATYQWERAVDDAGVFLDGWGGVAADLQWTAGDLFDVPREGRAGGLIWRLAGERVEALGPDHARLAGGGVFERGGPA